MSVAGNAAVFSGVPLQGGHVQAGLGIQCGAVVLHRHHAGAKPAEAGGAVTDMGADVEGEVAGREEAAVEFIQPRRPARRVVGPQRPADGPCGGHAAGGVS